MSFQALAGAMPAGQKRWQDFSDSGPSGRNVSRRPCGRKGLWHSRESRSEGYVDVFVAEHEARLASSLPSPCDRDVHRSRAYPAIAGLEDSSLPGRRCRLPGSRRFVADPRPVASVRWRQAFAVAALAWGKESSIRGLAEQAFRRSLTTPIPRRTSCTET